MGASAADFRNVEGGRGNHRTDRKEPLGKKARASRATSLYRAATGLHAHRDHIGVSRRIGSAEDRSRLRRVVTEAKERFPADLSFERRPPAQAMTKIRTTWISGPHLGPPSAPPRAARAPSLLHRDLNLVERILRDYSATTTSPSGAQRRGIHQGRRICGPFQRRWSAREAVHERGAIFEEFGIQQELDKALAPKVWLKSGGYIVINHTEALVAIDVNTGKYVGRGSTRLEDTIVKPTSKP